MEKNHCHSPCKSAREAIGNKDEKDFLFLFFFFFWLVCWLVGLVCCFFVVVVVVCLFFLQQHKSILDSTWICKGGVELMQ